MTTTITGKLTAFALLAALVGAATPALAGSGQPGAALRPQLSMRPPLLRPSIRPRVHIPAIRRHVARQLLNEANKPRRRAAPSGWPVKWTGPAAKSEGGPYLHYRLKNVSVSSYQTSGAGGY